MIGTSGRLSSSSRIILLYAAFILLIVSCGKVYQNPDASVEARVSDLLKRMTIDEKIGQMTQGERAFRGIDTLVKDLCLGSVLSGGGSVPSPNSPEGWMKMYRSLQESAMSTRLQIPVIYGIDALHGNNNVLGAVIFPHNIGLGCTRNPELVKKIASLTAMEIRATGLDWTFSPCIAVPQDIRWGRTYEGFGETTELQLMMSGPSVLGYQGDKPGTPYRVLACAKHYIGDGATTGGIDQGNAEMSEDKLRSTFLPGYIKAIEAGVGSVMVSYNSWNGLKCHANKFLVTDLLKNELKFDGFVVSDWEGVKQCAPDFREAIKLSVNAGLDMFMEPYRTREFVRLLKELVAEGSVSQERIDDAVRRILRIKFRMGLFENPFPDETLRDSLGSDYHRRVARQAVRESLVLLKNEKQILPLSGTSGRIVVAGPRADDIGSQCGGWTITWQGEAGPITTGTSILDAVRNVRGEENVFFSEDGTSKERADLAIVVVGETPYAEMKGDNPSLNLTGDDLKVIENVRKMKIPYVVLVISGRPLIMNKVIADAPAVVACWLPGTEALGITDVIFGDYEFTGKLSYTWPASIDQEPINFGDEDYDPLFPYGFGLTMK
ncbi:MAG: glycoside hydrolase family 3 C-terminal domain-containing protein [Bacteroidales bacterium]|nr:glycoside hydrolase family 3 C-terminal domain-containing protein [Bacteroidales bacterium]